MSKKKNILLIEDDDNLIQKIKFHAASHNYDLHTVSSIESGFMALDKEIPDLILLKLLSQKTEKEFAFCKKIKQQSHLVHIPILILANEIQEAQALIGLEIGIEDYLSKFISPQILFARIKNIFFRHKESSSLFSFGDFFVDTHKYLIKKGDHKIEITLSQFEILKTLLHYKGKVLTREQLLNHIQDKESSVIDRNIDVHIAALRKKLGPNFFWIETIRGIGYRFFT